ncbi:MAG: pectate lyase [Planctomycetota bacterium]
MTYRSVALVLHVLLLLVQPSVTAEQIEWGRSLLNRDAQWYSSAEARAVADSVMLYQSPQGGWPKNTDLARPPRTPEDIPQPGDGRANSLDNNATTLPMRFLARVAYATGEDKYRAAFLRGVDYLLAAQYANGGWPQFWPLRKGYYARITYNDSAIIHVMTLLRAAVQAKAPYDFIDDGRREKIQLAIDRGIGCILRTQVRQHGRLTAWCAQHDQDTLAPAWGRAYEPPSLAGGETVGIVEFLMSIEQPSDEVVASIEGAVAWLASVQIEGVRVERFRDRDGRNDRKLVSDQDAPPLWARFYELGTNRPLFVDRDSVFRYHYHELSHERRNGYAYLGTWPASLLKTDYPAWRQKHGLP